MSWILMSGAILFEVVGTVAIKLSNGFTRPLFVGVTIAGYLASFGLLGLALRGLEVSAAYAVWAGLGTALVAAFGIVALGESMAPVKIGGIVLIVAGVVAVHLADGPSPGF